MKSLPRSYHIAMASILKKRIAIHEKFLARKLHKLQQNKSHETIDSARNDRSLRFHNFTNIPVNDNLCKVISCGPSFIPTYTNEDPSSHKKTTLSRHPLP